ncbi:MAG: KAP family NTPase, partial [Desulfobacterales bacterium]|nr:KAP family NTPase [Desulfobacterales bacterium]
MADPVFIFPDNPLEKEADFGFSAYIDTISDLIANGRNKTPLVIGIYGKWGSGKTTLMRSIAHKLKNTPDYEAPHFRRCRPVWFQAWKYKDEDQILAALLEQILNTMARDDFFSKFKGEIEKLTQSLNPGNFLSVLLKKYTGVGAKDLLQELGHKKKLGFYDEFERSFKRLIWTYLSGRPQIYEAETYNDEDGVLTVFIDDLDRCPEPRIAGVLETVKLFMDIPGCVFVIGADNYIITRALEKSYQENAGRFMDKIIQVTFNLPKKPEPEFSAFLDTIMKASGQQIDPLLKEHLPLILPVLENNPRNFKRFLNDFSLQKGLVAHKKINVEKHLLLWNIIEKGFPSFYRALKKDRGYFTLETLIKVIHDLQEKTGEKGIDSFEAAEHPDIRIPDSLAEFVRNRNLISVLKKFNPSM